MKNILCAVDASPISLRALKCATALAEAFRGRLHTVEVVDVRMVADKSVADGILATAEEIKADVIVVGTHGRRGLERLVFGSVAETVLRKSSCPVLVVPAGRRAIVAPFKTIVCAVDFADASIAGLTYGRSLAAPRGRLILAHTIGWPFGEDTTAMPPPIHTLRRSLEREAADRLNRAATGAGCEGLRLEEAVTVGKPYEHILRCAREHRAELIVMGLHSHASNQLALLGSTTHHVIREAPCPVLTVRRPMAGRVALAS